jgi:hypothetical protein
LALPLLATAAENLPPGNWRSQRRTGAALTRLTVVTPATVAGRSETTRAKSSLARFMPQKTPEALTALTAVTPPVMS